MSLYKRLCKSSAPYEGILPGENGTSEIGVATNKKNVKCIPDIIDIIPDISFKKDKQILIVFGTSIFDTTDHQMTVQVLTSAKDCFCTNGTSEICIEMNKKRQ